jgi:hypothetical protein
LLIILIVATAFISWELYSIHAYRQTRLAVNAAQTRNDFDKAEDRLLDLEKLTKRSVILALTRKANVEFLINTHKVWKENLEKINFDDKEFSSKTEDSDFYNSQLDEIQTPKALPYVQPNEPTHENQEDLKLREQEFEQESDLNLDSEFFTFPDFSIDAEVFKRDYSCTNEELETLTKTKGEKSISVVETEGLQIIEKNQCKLEIEANLLNCTANCDKQRTIMEAILACRAQCDNEWIPTACDYYYDNPDHEYNKRITTLKKSLQEIQKNLDICWAERY